MIKSIRNVFSKMYFAVLIGKFQGSILMTSSTVKDESLCLLAHLRVDALTVCQLCRFYNMSHSLNFEF